MESQKNTPEKEIKEVKNENPTNGGKFTDVFLSEGDHNGKRYLATWVYSVLLLLALFISLLAIPTLSKRKEESIPNKEIKLRLDGPASVHVSVSMSGIDYIEIDQTKKDNVGKQTQHNEQNQLKPQSISHETQSGNQAWGPTSPKRGQSDPPSPSIQIQPGVSDQ